jgi:flagellar motor switch protein FliM
VDARQLSQVEIGIFAQIVKKSIQDLEATWEPILPVEIYDIELETNPEFMQITAASELCAVGPAGSRRDKTGQQGTAC